MRILHIINSLDVGGAEKLVLQLFENLNDKGIETTLLVLNSGVLDSRYNDKIVNLNVGNLRSIKSFFRLFNYIRRNMANFDIIHTHLFPVQYYVSIINICFGFKLKCKLFTTEHSTSNFRRKTIFKLLERIIYSSYSKIISISEIATVQLLKHLSCEPEKIVTISNGVDLKQIYNATECERSEFNFTDQDVIITMVAGFRPAKDQDTLVRALSILPNKYKLLFVGVGERLQEVKDLCTELNVDNRTKFLGLRNDVPSILKSSDVLIMSSYYEGLSLSSIEGLASGIPLIASNVIGLKEVVDGYGLLFELGDYQELANTITTLISDRVLYHEISVRSIMKSKEYSLEEMVQLYLKVY